jgi:hypothetical protein
MKALNPKQLAIVLGGIGGAEGISGNEYIPGLAYPSPAEEAYAGPCANSTATPAPSPSPGPKPQGRE